MGYKECPPHGAKPLVLGLKQGHLLPEQPKRLLSPRCLPQPLPLSLNVRTEFPRALQQLNL